MTSTPQVKTSALAQDRLDQVRFTMDEEQMQKFVALLDALAINKPRLAALISTPSPWEQKTDPR